MARESSDPPWVKVLGWGSWGFKVKAPHPQWPEVSQRAGPSEDGPGSPCARFLCTEDRKPNSRLLKPETRGCTLPPSNYYSLGA